MIRYVKGAAPARLTSLATTPQMTWDGLSAEDRDPLREALLRDQGGLCAYCQRRISAATDPATGRSRMKIEHWAARTTHPERQLSWTNMLGVCHGGAPGSDDAVANPIDRHCDERRGARDLFLHPVAGQGADPRPHLRYTKDGNVNAAGDDVRVERDIVSLNLRAPRLQRGRAAVYDEVLRRLERAKFSTQELRRLARANRIVAGTSVPVHAEFVRYHVLKKLLQRGETE